MSPAVGAMWRPHAFLNFKVSLNPHSQPPTVNSKHNLTKKKKSSQKLTLIEQ